MSEEGLKTGDFLWFIFVSHAQRQADLQPYQDLFGNKKCAE